jgi:calcineurin-like phosphoesterase family protein
MHFDHENIMHFDNREFKSVSEMNETMISNWNSVVSSSDTVYILGDFCWKTEDRWVELIGSLNGSKVLIRGNHDITPSKSRKLFADVKDYKEIDDEGRKVVLCHYPIPCFKNHFYGWYHLYGHVHSSFEYNMMEQSKYLMTELYTKQCNMYNVGCMMPYMNYTPRTLSEIISGYDSFKKKLK